MDAASKHLLSHKIVSAEQLRNTIGGQHRPLTSKERRDRVSGTRGDHARGMMNQALFDSIKPA